MLKVRQNIYILIKKYSNIFKDFILNIFSNVIIIVITQLGVFPLLSHDFSKIIFGSITSLYGINSVIIVLTGDALANVRLIENNKNGDDFNVLSLIDSVILSFTLSIILFYIYGGYLSIFDKIIFSITTSIMSLLEYGISIYRIRLKYNFYLIQNLFIAFGYVIGILLFKIYHYWSLIFITGNLFGLIFFLCKSNIIHESFHITVKITQVLKELINISIGHVLSSLVSNLDRFLIPIVLNMSYLPAFFAANTLSKMFNIVMGPLSDVLLSHLSKSNIKWNRHKLNYLTIFLGGCSLILILPSYLISIIAIKFLYSKIYYGYPYIKMIVLLSCISTCLFGIWNIINTIYLLCLKSRFQVFINSVFFISYLILSAILSIKFSLVGYTIGYTLSIILSCFTSFVVANFASMWKMSS